VSDHHKSRQAKEEKSEEERKSETCSFQDLEEEDN